MLEQLKWDANIFVAGKIVGRMEGRAEPVAIITTEKGRVRGFLFGDSVYVGANKQIAMKALQSKFDDLMPGVKNALRDKPQEV